MKGENSSKVGLKGLGQGEVRERNHNKKPGRQKTSERLGGGS